MKQIVWPETVRIESTVQYLLSCVLYISQNFIILRKSILKFIKVSERKAVEALEKLSKED